MSQSIAQFFAVIGVKVEGKDLDSLKNLDKSLRSIEQGVKKTLIPLAALTTGMAMFVRQTFQVSDAHRRFVAVTGLSSQELKKWEYAANQAGVSGDELRATLTKLRQVPAEIVRGGNVKPWADLGVIPTENAFKTLRDLRAALKGVDEGIANMFLQEAGLGDGMIALLRLTEDQLALLEERYILSEKERAALIKSRNLWADISFKVSAMRDKLVVSMLPVINAIATVLNRLVDKTAQFANWLNSGSKGANIVRGILSYVAIALVSITAALTVTLGLLSAIRSVTFVWALSTGSVVTVLKTVGSVLLFIGGLLKTIFVSAIALAAPFLIVAAKIALIVMAVMELTNLILKLFGIKTPKWLSPMSAVGGWLGEKAAGLMGGSPSREGLPDLSNTVGGDVSDWAMTPSLQRSINSTSNRQENNINLNMQSSGDPYRDGQTAARGIDTELKAIYGAP